MIRRRGIYPGGTERKLPKSGRGGSYLGRMEGELPRRGWRGSYLGGPNTDIFTPMLDSRSCLHSINIFSPK